MDNNKVLECTKDIVVAMIQNGYVRKHNDENITNGDPVIEITEKVFKKLSELNNEPKTIIGNV